MLWREEQDMNEFYICGQKSLWTFVNTHAHILLRIFKLKTLHPEMHNSFSLEGKGGMGENIN